MKLTIRQIKREEEILRGPGLATIRFRAVPITLFKKLLAASRWAVEKGFDSEAKP